MFSMPLSKTALRSSLRLRLVAIGAFGVAVFVLPEALADMASPAVARLIETDRSVSGAGALNSTREPALLASTNPVAASRRGFFSARSGPSQPLSVVTQGVLLAGEELGPVLRAKGITPVAIQLVSQEMRPLFDFRRSQPGDRYRLSQDAIGNVLDFRYATTPEESLHLFWNGHDFVVRREQAELIPRVERIAGIVETSLYRAIDEQGESPELASAFADLFAWDLDFTRNVHPGDEFQILYERLYRTDHDGYEFYVQPGQILAARFIGSAGEYAAVWYEGEAGRGGYYRRDGTSVQRAFLVAPLRFARITSEYSSSRRHPILKVSRPHHGIDYAAPEGTPLWSVADGTVIFKGRNGGFGNLVKIQHDSGYISYYAHLSGYARGLRVGRRVMQKEVVGYVGHTGLATGSHVCFRVAKNGHYVNPMGVASPAGKAIGEEQKTDFVLERDLLLGQLVAASSPYVDESF